MLTSQLTKDFSSLQSPAYLELFESMPALKKSYFNHPFFLFKCLHAFSKTEPCFLFSVFEGDALIGFDAFRKTKIKLRGISVNCLVPGGYKIAEYNMPVVNPGFYSEYFQQLSLVTKKESLFYHNCIAFYAEFFKKEVTGSFVYSITSNPLLKNSEDDIYKASLKKAGVRYLKVLKKSSYVETQHLKNNPGEELLNSFFELHIQRWASEGIESKFTENVYKEIYRSLFGLKIPNYGQPVLSYIKSNNEFLAMHMGFIIGNSFLYQVPALNVRQKSKSSGTILIKVIFDFLADEKINIFDMGYGTEEYKFRYMNDVINYFSMAKFSNPVYQKIFQNKSVIKIPGTTTILLYQLKNKEKIFLDENFKEFSSSGLDNNKWILNYFSESLCKKRWDDGSTMYYLTDAENTPCSFVWSKINTEHFFGEFNRKLIFPSEVNFLYDAITPGKHRGKGYYPVLLRKSALINNDYVSIGYAAPSNIPSTKGVLKAGFEPTHKINRILNFVKVTDLNNSGINFYAKKVN